MPRCELMRIRRRTYYLGKEATLLPKRCVPDATKPVFLADILPATFFTSVLNQVP